MSETKNLPAIPTKWDRAWEPPPDNRTSLTEVRAVTEDCEEAFVIGEGAAEQMDATGRWIQAEHSWKTLTSRPSR